MRSLDSCAFPLGELSGYFNLCLHSFYKLVAVQPFGFCINANLKIFWCPDYITCKHKKSHIKIWRCGLMMKDRNVMWKKTNLIYKIIY